VGYRAKKYKGLLDPYRSQEPRILYNSPEAYRALDTLVPYSFTV